MECSEKKIIIFFWLAKYKVFDMCDFLAMPLKVTGALLSLLLFLLTDMHASGWASHGK